jgi:hypothetical protein
MRTSSHRTAFIRGTDRIIAEIHHLGSPPRNYEWVFGTDIKAWFMDRALGRGERRKIIVRTDWRLCLSCYLSEGDTGPVPRSRRDARGSIVVEQLQDGGGIPIDHHVWAETALVTLPVQKTTASLGQRCPLNCYNDGRGSCDGALPSPPTLIERARSRRARPSTSANLTTPKPTTRSLVPGNLFCALILRDGSTL